MATRYDFRDILFNDTKAYREHFKNRGVKFIEQYDTPEFGYPTSAEISNLITIPHTWKYGDRYYKLAHKYYDDASLWWIIAWFNMAPTESHLMIGDTIFIPKPLEIILDYYEGY